MNFHCWRIVPITFVALICLGGCKGHFKFSDDQYRALGSPEPTGRLGVLRQDSIPQKQMSTPHAFSIAALRQDFQE
ncbi:hypothetical protein LT706_14350 [Pseudomonas syringae pv. syringae]|uniref:hypothetical protein n=1 Tax=Pseudomonas TaxID=286 RepID=UPI0006B9AD4B|nr:MULTISPECIES: hypothetical protein [Pseudomonas]KPB28145.1 Uncharacterized protein AC517_3244 [Pseudomonas syringae pv. syringae]MCK9701253.1 hypothetical protein [Pseudomonas syringae pv. syringae]MCK9712702.1 hypothetical protein [Pseudomonas syringae pv. syringae]MCK9717019.1 hypothetical protein [Pseudomonas syringae pv. syringae]MCK9742390.1 hypothetical protein [Pseudomonas syringae pv. syringae]